jgi:hypothetical protein
MPRDVSIIYFTAGYPSVKRVTDWPGQGRQQGEAKIPSLIWSVFACSYLVYSQLPKLRYDQHGNPVAFGAEAYAMDPAEAEDEGHQLAKHFKLHLHPESMRSRSPLSLDPLPKGVTIDKIYADFFRYLYGHMQTFFRERELQGTKIWQDLIRKNKIEFVIAHPNGWTTNEQAFLRRAVVQSGLLSESKAPQSVHMLTEAEASVHFVVFHGGGNVERQLEVRPQHGH